GNITHYACLTMTLDGQTQVLNFLVTNIGADDVILGLPWLCKANPDGTLDLEDPPRKKLNVVTKEEEDVEKPKGLGWIPTGESVLEEDSEELDLEQGAEVESKKKKEGPQLLTNPPLYWFTGNQETRRAWIRAGYMEEFGDKLWVCANYTVSQQIAKHAAKWKKPRTFKQ
ncbi:hypothetical protein BDV98DRAFT_478036, partial [Pterulicium gracile]